MFKFLTWLFGILAFVLILISLSFYLYNFSTLFPIEWKASIALHAPKWLWDSLSDLAPDKGDWGTFGDFLGGTLNPIFGFFGFLVLLATLSLQRTQLDEQRKDMEEQRKAAKEAAYLQAQQLEAQKKDMQAQQEALALSNQTQIKQQFEGTFFTYMDFLNKEYFNIIKPSKNISQLSPHQNLIKKISEALKDKKINIFDLKSGIGQIDGSVDFFTKYLKILTQILIKINDLNYPNKEKETIIEKNSYVDTLLINTDKELILLLCLGIFNDEHGYYKIKDLSVEERNRLIALIKNLGLLRELDFSPFNKNYRLHKITIELQEAYGEQAFKPIEVPPASP